MTRDHLVNVCLSWGVGVEETHLLQGESYFLQEKLALRGVNKSKGYC